MRELSAERPKSTHCAHYVPSHDHGVKWSKALEGAIGGLHLAHKTKNGEGAESAFHAQRTYEFGAWPPLMSVMGGKRTLLGQSEAGET